MKVFTGNPRLDYFPLLSFFFFWLSGAVAGALKIGEPGLILLGLATAPALAALIAAGVKIRRHYR